MYLLPVILLLLLFEDVQCRRLQYYSQNLSKTSAKAFCSQEEGRLMSNAEDLSFIQSCFPDRENVWIDLQLPLLSQYNTEYKGCVNASNRFISDTWKEFPQTSFQQKTETRLCARWCDMVAIFTNNKTRIGLSQFGHCICFAASINIFDLKADDAFCMFSYNQGPNSELPGDYYNLYDVVVYKGHGIGHFEKDGNISIDYDGNSHVICSLDDKITTKEMEQWNIDATRLAFSFSVHTCSNLSIQFAVNANGQEIAIISTAEEAEKYTSRTITKYATFAVTGTNCFCKQFYDAELNETHLRVMSDKVKVLLPLLDQLENRTQKRYFKNPKVVIESRPICKEEIRATFSRSDTTSKIEANTAPATKGELLPGADPVPTLYKILFVSAGIACFLLCTAALLICLLKFRFKKKEDSTLSEATEQAFPIGTVDNDIYLEPGQVEL